MANGLLGLLPDVDGAPLTLERILGLVFAPLVWLIGVPAADARLEAPRKKGPHALCVVVRAGPADHAGLAGQ